jgi:tRNA(fMet)-specific endonuclease VapC
VTLRYLLDTNVVSEPLRPRPARGVLERMRRHEKEIGIASIVWHELRYGCARLPAGARREAIERYLQDVVLASFPVLVYDGTAAEWHAAERARLAAAGTPPPFVDGQIAAIAAVHDLILVTANASDFRRFKGLRVQRW